MPVAKVRLRVLTPDDWALFREVRLNALREAPYAFSATLADWQGANDSEPRWRLRLTDVPFNVVAYVDDTPAGMVSGTTPDADDAVGLIGLWVAPFARHRGVANALVGAVLSWARERSVAGVWLNVMDGNRPARALYQRFGFVDREPGEYRSQADPEGHLRCERAMLLRIGPRDASSAHLGAPSEP